MDLSRKVFAVVIAAIMLITVIPMSAFAETIAISDVDVTIDLEDIVNSSPENFVERISVNQEGLRVSEYASVCDAGQTIIPAESFEYGKSYWVSMALYVEDGYTLEGYTARDEKYDGNNLSVSVNGEEFSYVYIQDPNPLKFNGSIFSVYPQHYSHNGDLRICIEYVFEIPENPTLLEKIAQALSDFFEPIAIFFTEILFQPIADLIMKIS